MEPKPTQEIHMVEHCNFISVKFCDRLHYIGILGLETKYI